MTKINDLSQGNLGDLKRQQHRDQYSTPLNGSSVGSGGMRFYGSGSLRVENEGLIVTGEASISGSLAVTGTLTQAGTSTFTGETNLNGPTNVAGAFTVTGETNLDGPTAITGALTVTGLTKLNGDTTVAGDTTVSGQLEVTGAMATKGTLSVEGVTTLKNNLNVDAGKKINLGSISLESGGSSGGQINLVGGALSSSASFGTLLVSNTLEVAGTSQLKLSAPTVTITSLPTTTQKANLYVDAIGRLYRSTAV